jgi:catechol 2,3-dioxygenase
MLFYRDGLGFGGLFIIRAFGMGDVGLDYMPHAIAFNIWAGADARPAPAGAAGLRFFTIEVPDEATLSAVRGRLERLNAPIADIAGGIETADPSGNRVRVVARA